MCVSCHSFNGDSRVTAPTLLGVFGSTVELADGSLFTVYYQQAAAGEKNSLLWSRWRLPE